jgi:aspartate aminotransferase-like enzyme
MPRFYFDLKAARQYLERGQTPWTPNVAAFYGLSAALDKLLDQGMESVFEHHAHIGQLTRDGVKELGLDLLAQDEARASNTVTAVKIPQGVDGPRLVRLMHDDEHVVLAGGQGKLVGKIFRIGHLGYVSREDIEEVLAALERVLPKVGFNAG